MKSSITVAGAALDFNQLPSLIVWRRALATPQQTLIQWRDYRAASTYVNLAEAIMTK